MFCLCSQNKHKQTIVFDVPHGGSDYGVASKDSIFFEKDFLLQIAKNLENKFANNLNVKFILTRNSDINIKSNERMAKAKKYHADLFFVLHFNSSFYTQSCSVIYNSYTDVNLLNLLRENTKKNFDCKDVEFIKNENLLIFKNYKENAIILEIGDLYDEKYINFLEKKGLQKISETIYKLLTQYLTIKH